MIASEIKTEIKKFANKQKAEFFPRFFKSGPSEYGEGDIFIGVTVPNSRLVAKKYKDLPLSEIQKLLKSDIHEERLVALLILVEQYKKADYQLKEEIYNFYLSNTKYVNNWDLVDLSSEKIVGEYLLDKNKAVLYKLAKSRNLWERRMAIISTYAFIKRGYFLETLKVSKLLLSDKHDLIHKAVGWMLREVGKRDQKILEKFLKTNYRGIPRTTLRYAIERFPKILRLQYLKGTQKLHVD